MSEAAHGGDARAARTAPFVMIHLGSAAPGCEAMAIGDEGRWRSFYNRPPLGVIAALLSRLQRLPSEVTVRTIDPPLHVVDLEADVAGVTGVVASIVEGITAAEATDLLAQLAAQGWRPTRLLTGENIHG